MKAARGLWWDFIQITAYCSVCSHCPLKIIGLGVKWLHASEGCDCSHNDWHCHLGYLLKLPLIHMSVVGFAPAKDGVISLVEVLWYVDPWGVEMCGCDKTFRFGMWHFADSRQYHNFLLTHIIISIHPYLCSNAHVRLQRNESKCNVEMQCLCGMFPR